jgi:predicted dinucleotide-utilizing enzyme
LADRETEAGLRKGIEAGKHGVYVPAGALWGSMDIRKMDERGQLSYLSVTMKKHPDSLKLVGRLDEELQKAKLKDGEVVIYEGIPLGQYLNKKGRKKRAEMRTDSFLIHKIIRFI